MAKTSTEYRSNTLRLIPTEDQSTELRLLAHRVSALWNVANYTSRQRFIARQGVPSYATLCRDLRTHPVYRSLPSDIAQEILKKLSEAWTSFFALRARWARGELQDKPGLPRYRKDRRSGRAHETLIPIKSNRSYAVSSQHAALTLPRDRRNHGRLNVPYRGLRRHTGSEGRAEIRFDTGRGRWYLQYSVNAPPRTPRAWNRSAAIDLGVRILASVSIEGEPGALHFSGRDVLKDWDYWGRQIASHQRELAHRGKKSSQRLRRLYLVRQDRLKHAWEAIAAKTVHHLKCHRVGTVYLGHPRNILRKRSYHGPWSDRIHNFWGFDRALRILEKHLRRARIQSLRVGERGSSSTCTVDPTPEDRSHKVVRTPRHLLSCRTCGLRMHSDQAGSRNILRQQIPSIRWDRVKATPRTETLRWNSHRWADCENPYATHSSPSTVRSPKAQLSLSL